MSTITGNKGRVPSRSRVRYGWRMKIKNLRKSLVHQVKNGLSEVAALKILLAYTQQLKQEYTAHRRVWR